MVSHHHRKKIQRRRKKLLRILSAIMAVVLMFLGTGELFQGSSVLGVALVGIAAVLLFLVFAIKIK
ncbi:MAG TPA: hypothetical protein ENN20_08500 [Candidatus Marinimicrobia bacterium]|nr:hypothetical protein [Candidatus Neomarinimicrobiota bacterium]